MDSKSTADILSLSQAVRNGERRAASRLISMLESNDAALALAASNAVQSFKRPRHVIGFTGPPGAGKSTLLDYLLGMLRADGTKVGVIAVDPSSPFTGGALLGDRIRMDSHRNDAGVFIRSMGSRGAPGGLASAVSDTLRVLGGVGFECVLIESVGAGQNEVEIARIADSVCVLQVPGLGDDLQLMKMGILEIGDVFIVHKSDRPGAVDLKTELELALHEAPGETNRHLRELGPEFTEQYRGPRWTPEVLGVSSFKREGGEALVAALKKHREFLDTPDLAHALERERLSREILERATRQFKLRAVSALKSDGSLAQLVDETLKGTLDVAQAAERLREAKL